MVTVSEALEGSPFNAYYRRKFTSLVERAEVADLDLRDNWANVQRRLGKRLSFNIWGILLGPTWAAYRRVPYAFPAVLLVTGCIAAPSLLKFESAVFSALPYITTPFFGLMGNGLLLRSYLKLKREFGDDAPLIEQEIKPSILRAAAAIAIAASVAVTVNVSKELQLENPTSSIGTQLSQIASLSGIIKRSGTVEIKDGNLYLKNDSGELTQLTKGGNNLDATMSSDGETVAYLHDRRTSEDEEEGYDTELRLYRLNPKQGQDNPAVVLPVKDDSGFELYMRAPTFSDDPRYLYAIAPTNETSGTIYRYDLQENSWERIIDGNSVEVVMSGTFKGHLLVSRHRYHPEGSSYDETYLVSTLGEIVYAVPGSRVGADENEAGSINAIEGWKRRNS